MIRSVRRTRPLISNGSRRVVEPKNLKTMLLPVPRNGLSGLFGLFGLFGLCGLFGFFGLFGLFGLCGFFWFVCFVGLLVCWFLPLLLFFLFVCLLYCLCCVLLPGAALSHPAPKRKKYPFEAGEIFFGNKKTEKKYLGTRYQKPFSKRDKSFPMRKKYFFAETRKIPAEAGKNTPEARKIPETGKIPEKSRKREKKYCFGT